MKKYMINFTNHPSKRWEESQVRAALEYGEIVDLPFPAVNPQKDEGYIDSMAEDYFRQIMELHPRAVLCQGEFCLSYQVIARLRKEGITVLAACSERIVKETGQKKEVEFVFRRFRKYGEGACNKLADP